VETGFGYRRAVEEVIVLDTKSLAAVYTWHLTRPSSFDLFLENAREKLRCSDMSETCSLNGSKWVEHVDVDGICKKWFRTCRVPVVMTKCKETRYMLFTTMRMCLGSSNAGQPFVAVNGCREAEFLNMLVRYIQRAWRSCRYKYNLSVVLSVLTCCAPEYQRRSLLCLKLLQESSTYLAG